MPFATPSYIIFFCIVFFAYYAVPRRLQWWLLLIASWAFYGWASLVFPVFLFVTVSVTFFGAVSIQSNSHRQHVWLEQQGASVSGDERRRYKVKMARGRKVTLAIVISILVCMLGVFKYGGWIACMFGGAMNVILPVGLSFYVFQSIGYCIDVYREEFPAEKNFFKHALFVSFFPQLLQGPIGSYSELRGQLFEGKVFDYRQVAFGLQRVVWGFFKKIVIANHIALLIDDKWMAPTTEGFVVWAVILCLYSIQLYADFSGYMDIACGCAQMLGMRLGENFDAPYLSKSISEFWRRWHITLGAWFRNYLFYPILRSETIASLRRRISNKRLSSAVPTVVALFVVWFLIGLWHGADWCYVLYGLYHGAFVILGVCLAERYQSCRNVCERLFGRKAYAGLQVVRTFAIVTLGYVLFRPGSIDGTAGVCARMFSRTGAIDCVKFIGINFRDFLVVGPSTCILILVDMAHSRGVDIRYALSRRLWFVRWPLYASSVVVILLFGAYGSEALDQFAYFGF